MFQKRKDRPLSHDENRQSFCLICLKRKNLMRKIEGALKNHVLEIVDFDPNDERLPTVVCASCKILVYKALKSENKSQIIKLPDYSGFKKIKKTTRTQKEILCDCSLCELARKPGHVNFSQKETHVNAEEEIEKCCLNCNQKIAEKNLNFCRSCSVNFREKVKKCCLKCDQEFTGENFDVCGCSANYTDLKRQLSNLSTKEKEHVVCTLLQDIKGTKKINKNQSDAPISLSQEKGKPMNITLNAKPNLKRKNISADEVAKIATNCNLSSRKVLSIASDLRVATDNRKLFESGLKENLTTLNRSLDSFFEVKKVDVISAKGKKSEVITKNLVFCNDVQNLIKHITTQRNVSGNVHLKIGIDGGGGFLKICVSILSEQSESDTSNSQNNRKKYIEGVAAKKFKESGVKKLLILGLIDNTQENFDNVLQLWSILKLNDLNDFTIATDLKLANILVGIMGHASFFPCTWCFSSKDQLDECGEYRTLGDCLNNSSAFKESGGNKKNAKNYKSSIHSPIFTGDDDALVLDVIPPPELHLLLGVVNTLYKSMLQQCENDSLRWAKECNVTREFVHGGPAFAGNSCKKLLNKVDILRSFCCIKCLKYVKCYQNFGAVVDSCFSQELGTNFEQKILAFQKSYCDLNISITPKVHAVFFHILHFCRRTGKGLGFFSEQCIESVHADFKNTWAKYKVSNTNVNYPENLLKAVREYNSRHI